ncbi:protein translocase subunit SecF [Candidatus Woesearchaeota archaeon]|nr:protein translocase subunit SecF [Candidatus Woesearchaeota archaeon]
MDILGLSTIYNEHYKKLMVLSFILLFASVIVLGVNYAQTGELFKKGVSLKGGITITIPTTDIDVDQLEAGVSGALQNSDVVARAITEAGVTKAVIVEAADTTREQLEDAIKNQGIDLVEGEYSVESMGGALGENFFRQTMKALVFAFIAMAIVVFITFRALVPSLFVILAAFSDIATTLAAVDVLGMRLGTAGIAAFLMLIGYSVDTDILLTTKVLKRRKEGGTLYQRTVKAMKTGLIMSLTSLVAALAAAIFSQSDTIKQIMIIVAIGLFFDMLYTWIQNAGILRWWMEKKYGKD